MEGCSHRKTKIYIFVLGLRGGCALFSSAREDLGEVMWRSGVRVHSISTYTFNLGGKRG